MNQQPTPPDNRENQFALSLLERGLGAYFALAKPVMNLSMRFGSCGVVLVFLFVISMLGLAMLVLLGLLLGLTAIELSPIGDLIFIGSAITMVVTGFGAGFSQRLRSPAGIGILLLMGATLSIGAWAFIQTAPPDTLEQLQGLSPLQLLERVAFGLVAIVTIVMTVIGFARGLVDTVQEAFSSPWKFLRFAFGLIVWGVFFAFIAFVIYQSNLVDQQIAEMQATAISTP